MSGFVCKTTFFKIRNNFGFAIFNRGKLRGNHKSCNGINWMNSSVRKCVLTVINECHELLLIVVLTVHLISKTMSIESLWTHAMPNPFIKELTNLVLLDQDVDL